MTFIFFNNQEKYEGRILTKITDSFLYKNILQKSCLHKHDNFYKITAVWPLSWRTILPLECLPN